MAKVEIELTEDQLEKVEILKSKDISIGEAIDLLFEVHNEIIDQIKEQDSEEDIIEKINDEGYGVELKATVLKKNFEESETYEKAVRDTKQDVKWSKLFKF